MSFGSTLLAEVIGGLVTGLVLTVLVAWRDAFQRTVANDAVVGDILEDTARFVRDRNRLLAVQMVAEFEAALRVNQQEGLEHASAIASLKRQVLHEYRDEITRKRRRYRDTYNSEGLLEVVVRHYRKRRCSATH